MRVWGFGLGFRASSSLRYHKDKSRLQQSRRLLTLIGTSLTNIDETPMFESTSRYDRKP